MVSALNGKARIGGLLLLYFVATSTLAVASDATNLFVITKTGFVLNRTTNTYDTTVTLKNISPLTVNAPVQLVVSGLPSGVTLANAAGTNQGKPYVNVTVPGNSIIAGQIVTPIVLKFSNPSRVTITATLAMSADIPQAAVGLPPDPGEPGKATVAGIDSNGNGVRDDVERWIAFNYPTSARERAALTQSAISIQHFASGGGSREQYLLETQKEGDCLGATFMRDEADVDGGRRANDALRAIKTVVLNTGDRTSGYFQSDGLLSGSTTRSTPFAERGNNCLISPTSLAN